ncbi:MAG: magnesium transporter CorA [Lachnospiraceae bacterium]|nr:magnesium transporter CorA [Lachnospiraceae bacterium]
MYYLIDTMLQECSLKECHGNKKQYVAVLDPQEWIKERESFEMGIDIEPDTTEIYATNADVNYDSVTGAFSIPDRRNILGECHNFAFALDEKGIVFIDPADIVTGLIKKITLTKKWRMPSLERFIYDFLEQIVYEDSRILESYEKKLDIIDNELDSGNEADLEALNDIRGELRDLRTHYNQLIELAQEFEENENNFFKAENLRFFRLFSNRVSRLYDIVNSLLDYTNQIKDTYQSHLDVKQNRIMTVLTVVTTIFMPLTLIVGWYGMNFKYMPELESEWGYPVVIALSAIIVIFSLIFFKKKKWL